jgi:thiol-disulfide isomerase/thioredoxin
VSPKPSQGRQRAQAVAKRQQAAAAQRRRNRMLLWGGLAVVVVIAIVVAVVAGGGGSDGDSASATQWETAAVKVDGTSLPQFDAQQAPDPAIGKAIPTLTGKSVFTGDPVKVEPNGKPQAVIFLAHWCPHCRAEVPRLVALAKDGVFDGVDVTAVATGTNEAAVNYPPSAWLKREHWPFAVMAEDASFTAADAYGISAYPYFVLVNADGTVAGRGTGELPPSEVRANIAALKAGKPLPLVSSNRSSAS